MSSLNQQYEGFLKENPWAIGMSYEQWELEVFTPKLKKIKRYVEKLNNE